MVEAGPTPHEGPKRLERNGKFYVQEIPTMPGVRIRTSSPFPISVKERDIVHLYDLARRHEQIKGIIHRASVREKTTKHQLREIANEYPLLRGIESDRENENFYLNIYPVREWRKKLLQRVLGVRFFSVAVGDYIFELRYPVGTFKSGEEIEMKRRQIVDFVVSDGYDPMDAERMVQTNNSEVKIDEEQLSKVVKEGKGRYRVPRRIRELKYRVIKSDAINKGLKTLAEFTRRSM
ncbi:hypothetical protein M1307_03870 [Patescibacteria group bacterium]|nr:hypothetical protein [Patescibacteria group bacterium]